MTKRLKFLPIWVAGMALLLGACRKDEPTISGSASEAEFTYAVTRVPGGDTLPYVSRVTFTNTSKDAFSYLWDFGDNGTSSLANPVHNYRTASVYTVSLTSVGSGGNNKTTRTISIDGACAYNQYADLTGCSSRRWSMSPVSDAIRILSADGSQTFFSGAATSCQTDDIYSFFADGSLNYDAKGGTFLANEGPAPYSCQAAQQNASKFIMIKSGTGNPRIILDSTGVGRRPFIGTTDRVVGNAYEVLDVSASTMTLQGVLLDGSLLRMKFINGFDINTIKLYLTGGSRRTWMLDTTAGANAITAGVEANPTQYFGGGPLASCQTDDWYTFTQTDSIYVNCNGSTLLPPTYTCGADKSFRRNFSFGSVVGSVAGLAQISLPSNDPNYWIGVFDRAPENVYRILNIDNETMILRSGNGSGTVHDIKFKVKR